MATSGRPEDFERVMKELDAVLEEPVLVPRPEDEATLPTRRVTSAERRHRERRSRVPDRRTGPDRRDD